MLQFCGEPLPVKIILFARFSLIYKNFQLSSLNNEKATLTRKLDELREVNETLTAENTTLKLRTSGREVGQPFIIWQLNQDFIKT